MADNRDAETFFKHMSIAEFQNLSAIGEVQRYGPFSFTTGLNDLYNISPNAANANEVKQILCTLIKILFKPR